MAVVLDVNTLLYFIMDLITRTRCKFKVACIVNCSAIKPASAKCKNALLMHSVIENTSQSFSGDFSRQLKDIGWNSLRPVNVIHFCDCSAFGCALLFVFPDSYSVDLFYFSPSLLNMVINICLFVFRTFQVQSLQLQKPYSLLLSILPNTSEFQTYFILVYHLKQQANRDAHWFNCCIIWGGHESHSSAKYFFQGALTCSGKQSQQAGFIWNARCVCY